MEILAAPIQEYTDAAFRNAHACVIGVIDEYYAPFARLEQGELPRRALVDLAPENNGRVKVVPQILAKSPGETRTLLSRLGDWGYKRVDLNIGCPFPKVVKDGYGAGMLDNPERVCAVVEEAFRVEGIRLSVKMRLGIVDANDWRALLPLLNEFPLKRIVLHPRTAIQQYGGIPDREAFLQFREASRNPVVYNGDILAPGDAEGLGDVMIGRGLLANPLLPLQLRGEIPAGNLLSEFHRAYFEECKRIYKQPLLKLKLLWDYFLPEADKRLRKSIRKAVTLDDYLSLTDTLLEQF